MDGINDQGSTGRRHRFISLRTKLVLFISLIIVTVCSGLGWFFIQQQVESMTRSLLESGSILVKNLARSSRYSLIAHDKPSLQRLIDATIEVEQVVYVVMTGPEREPLLTTSKGILTDGTRLSRAGGTPLYPDPAYAMALFESASSEPALHRFSAATGETIYDFAVPVLRRPEPEFLPGALAAETQETPQETALAADAPDKVHGIVQIGVTGSIMQRSLNTVMRNVALITFLTILAGIAAAILLAGQIITPLRSLATVSRRVAEGDLTASVEPTTHDEVGQLTIIFNKMTRSLEERDHAISSNIDTITRQVKQLTALNQAGAAITSTLDLDKLLETVLKLLVENVGYTHTLLMLYDPVRRIAFGARAAGVSQEVERRVRELEVPVSDDGSIHAELLHHGRPLNVPDINTAADRIHPLFLTLARQVGVTSFICAPLRSKDRILGFVCADRGGQPCTKEDLDLLMTIASHVAVATDNAQAYQELELLAQSLEQRVQKRTLALQVANEKLQELDRLKSAFVTIVSHELRTPMTSIKGYVENMLDGLTGNLNERQTHYLTRVKYNTERLTRLINDLLDLSRIEAGRIELALGPVSIVDLVADVLETVQTSASKKSITVEARHARGLPMVRGDRDKLHHILTNLVQNATKFTPQGGEIQVESLVRDDGFVQLCVADTGCGIQAHEIDKVFEKFYRGELAPPEARGAGLGLAITKSLVELHGGRIWVESAPGEGSRFFFTVPTQPSSP